MVAKKPKKRVLRDDSSSRLKEESTKQQDTTSDSVISAPEKTPARTLFSGLGWLIQHLFPRYFITSFRELRQVSWPNRKETRQLTTAVIIFAIAVGFIVAVVDLGLDKIFKKVILKQ